MRRRRILMVILAGVMCVSGIAAAGIAKGTLAASPPAISVSGYPAPGNQLAVAGSGFPSGHVVSIRYDSTTPLGTAYVHQMGIMGTGNTNFTTTVAVPLDTTLGTHTITVTDPQANITVSTNITLHDNWPMFGFSAEGTRYNPYETAISPQNISQLTLAWTLQTSLGGGGVAQNGLSIADGRMIMGGGSSGPLTAWSTDTQQVLWTNYTEMWEQPAVVNGVVYEGPSSLIALDAATGSILWHANDVWPLDSSPTVANGFVYAQVGNGLYAYRANGCGQYTCIATWGYVPSQRFDGVPAVSNGSVYEGSEDGHLYVLNASTGAVQWTGTTLAGRVVGGALVDGNYVIVQVGNSSAYVQDSVLYVFPAAGCGQAACAPLWSAVDGAADGIAPAAANGVIYIGSQDHHLYAYNEGGCGSTTCGPIWAGTASGEVNTPLAVANGVVYGATWNGHQLLAYNAGGCGSATCAPIWSYNTTVSGFPYSQGPVVANGYVYFITEASWNEVFAFNVPGTTPAHANAGPASTGKGRPGTALPAGH